MDKKLLFEFLRNFFKNIYYLFISVLFGYLLTIRENTKYNQGINIWDKDSLELFLLAILILFILYFSYFFIKFKISWQFVLGWFGVYFLFLWLSYFVKMTYRLNRSSFDWSKFNENYFFNSSTFGLILLLTATVIGIIFIKEYINSLQISVQKNYLNFDATESIKEFKFFVTATILAFLITTDNRLLYVIFKTKLSNSIESLFNLEGFSTYFVLVIFSYFFVKGLYNIAKCNFDFYSLLSSSFILAIVFNFFIQQSVRVGNSFFGVQVFSGAIEFQFWILFVLFLLIYLLMNRYLLSTLTIIIMSSFFVFANTLKIEMRGEPVLPVDLIWISKPQLLLSFVNKNITLILIVGLIVIISLIWFYKQHFLYNKIIKSWKVQLSLIIVFSTPFFLAFKVLSNKENGKIKENIPVLSVLQNSEDISWQGTRKSASYKSLAYIWMNQLSTPSMYSPEGYNAAKIKELEERYSKLSQSINKSRDQQIKDHTIIYILSESFANPSRINGVQVSRNPIPNIQEIMSGTTSGTMKSDGFGGGTANMEFQSLTGLPYYNLNPGISVIYLEVVPQMNRFVSISDFYNPENKYAIHLSSKSNYSRDLIYRDLNFKTFISSDSKNIEFEREGQYPSDKSTYQQVIKQLGKPEGQFFSVITMQNHGIWMEDRPEDLTANGAGFNQDQQNNLNSYVKLLSQTDTATKDFLDQLSKIDKKITVVFYGDHLPGLYPQSIFDSNPESQYLTDYFIWSNFETPKLDYPLVNSSDFTALALEQTNSKVSPYQALLTEVLHKASVDKDPKKLDADAKQVAEDMKLVEYDIVSGKGYLSKDFFKAPSK